MDYDLYMKRLTSRVNKSKYTVPVVIDFGNVPVFLLGENNAKRIPVPFTEYELDGMVDMAGNFDVVYQNTILELVYDVRYCLSTADKKMRRDWVAEGHRRKESLNYTTEEAVKLLVG